VVQLFEHTPSKLVDLVDSMSGHTEDMKNIICAQSSLMLGING